MQEINSINSKYNQYDRHLPAAFYVFTVFLLALSFINGRYFFEIWASVLTLFIITYLFWREHHPPLFFMSLLFIWISITTGIYYVTLTGESIRDLLWRPFYSLQNINKAFWYSLLGLLFFSIGIKLSLGKTSRLSVPFDKIQKLNIPRLLIVYVLYVPITDYLFERLRVSFAGLSQFFYMLKLFKWALFFLLTIAVFYQRRYQSLFWLVFVYSIVSGFVNYFSTFKEYFLYLPIAYLSVKKLNTKQGVTLTVLLLLLIYISIYWSYIKLDYRSYLSGGRRSQTVVVSKTQALRKFFSYTKYFDKERFRLGEKALFKRLFYLEYFSATIRHIPMYAPFMKGYNTMRAIKHVLMPRFLFPNKPPLDDSKHTMQLTGIYVASAKQGTSISTGYMAEFYADYGPYYMLLATLILGIVWGLIYKFIIFSSPDLLWGFALTMPIFFLTYNYGKDLAKYIGDMLWFVISFLLIRYSILKPVINFFYMDK